MRYLHILWWLLCLLHILDFGWTGYHDIGRTGYHLDILVYAGFGWIFWKDCHFRHLLLTEEWPVGWYIEIHCIRHLVRMIDTKRRFFSRIKTIRTWRFRKLLSVIHSTVPLYHVHLLSLLPVSVLSVRMIQITGTKLISTVLRIKWLDLVVFRRVVASLLSKRDLVSDKLQVSVIALTTRAVSGLGIFEIHLFSVYNLIFCFVFLLYLVSLKWSFDKVLSKSVYGINSIPRSKVSIL